MLVITVLSVYTSPEVVRKDSNVCYGSASSLQLLKWCEVSMGTLTALQWEPLYCMSDDQKKKVKVDQAKHRESVSRRREFLNYSGLIAISSCICLFLSKAPSSTQYHDIWNITDSDADAARKTNSVILGQTASKQGRLLLNLHR